MQLSLTTKKVPASPIRSLMHLAEIAQKRGTHIYRLNIGDPDIETPQVMIEALKNWKINPIGYSDSKGEEELLVALLEYYKNLGVSGLDKSNMQVTMGGSEGLLWTFLSICDPGDEIIMFEPFYTNYRAYAAMADVNIIPITRKIEDNFALPSMTEISKKITAKTKAILICSPDNPTGAVYTESEILQIIEIAKKHKLFVVSDEVYREFIYNGYEPTTILKHAAKHKQGIIMVDSLSKRYSLCGARIGAIVSYNTEFIDACLKYGQARLSAGLVDQILAAKLSELPKDYFEKISSRYNKRRKALISGLNNIKGVFCSSPKGAFYCIARLPVKNAQDFCKWLVGEFSDKGETVLLTPAEGFYMSPQMGHDEVRIAYVLNQKSIERCVGLIDLALKKYKKL